MEGLGRGPFIAARIPGVGIFNPGPGVPGRADIGRVWANGKDVTGTPSAVIRSSPMSVAFTREEDLEATAADLPDRPISPHPNLVTANGLRAIEAALADARAAYNAAQTKGDIEADRTPMARAARDLRYWSARRASAQLVETTADGRVRFGGSVTLEREDGRTQTWRIVGEDEADPAAGSVSHVSPLARALIGKRAGDEATVAGQAVEVIAVD
jgi:transcription elongation GreA/GreB family factor